MRRINLVIKRCIDVSVSFVALVALFPLLLIIALLIRVTSSGEVLFKQKRIGYKGKTFEILKFRTMVVDAEKTGDGLFVYGDNDSRITSIGKILRKTSLDELPQLVNVLCGEMSLVGPRPPVTYFPYNGYKNYPTWAKKRFRMRPGITGLAQVTTRTTANWDKRIEIDNKYVDKFNVLLDFKILLMTVSAVLGSKNIYPESKAQIDNHADKTDSQDIKV